MASLIPTPESVALFYQAGSSDKVYQVQLSAEGAGWVVLFQFGRRGGTLKSGTKTVHGPMGYQSAKAIYDELVGEKMAKGYTPKEGEKLYTATPQAERATGVFPVLLVVADANTANLLIQSIDFIAEEKFDGQRILIKKDGDKVIGINRDGLQIGISTELEAAALTLPGSFILDGESVGDVYHSFDILKQDGSDYRNSPWLYRNIKLAMLIKVNADGKNVGLAHGVIQMSEVAKSPTEKAQLLETLRTTGREGIVFKRVTANYTPGRPTTKIRFDGPHGAPSNVDYFKLKFKATATVLVSKVNAKRSVQMAVQGADGSTTNVGNVTIPANHDIPQVGDFVEVEYLYAHRGGSIYQGVYLGKRTDKHEADDIEDLKYKEEPVA